MHFWDTSALAKLYVSEPDSPAFKAHVVFTGTVHASELVRWELFRVLARKEADGVLASGSTESVFARFQGVIAQGNILLAPLSEDVEARFRQLVLRVHRQSQGVLVRTSDAIHIATALLHGAVGFAVTDTTMRKGATAAGFTLFPN